MSEPQAPDMAAPDTGPRADAPAISFTYSFTASQKDDFLLGCQHQAYENEQWLLGEGQWRRYWRRALFDNAGHAALACAITYAVLLWGLPLIRSNAGYWIFLPFPAAMLTCWLVLRYTGKGDTQAYQNGVFRSLLWFEDRYAGPRHVTLGPEGMSYENRTERVFLHWRRYILALDQPLHLVLVFQGTVLVIPHEVLPAPGREIAGQINAWVAAACVEPETEAASLQDGASAT
ncbi:hypothetical protein ACLBXM_22730 [Xanthobacteraceae bacterium A53D]